MRENGCGNCRYAERIEREKGKQALRCLRKGSRCGRVVSVFPIGLSNLETEAPVWCGGFEKR